MNIILILSSVMLNAMAQLLIRKGMLQVGELGMDNFVSNLIPMISNVWLWGAMGSYVVSFVLWIAVLSRCEVGYAYPFLSVGYVVTAIAGYCFFQEDISMTRIVGIVVICVGVILISRS